MRRQAIERLLPAVYQRVASPGSVLHALLDVMEVMHAPSEELLASVDDLFDPYRAPERLVPFLSQWTAMDHVAARLPIPVGRKRDVVAESATLARWRGTATGLRAVIEIATGASGLVIEEPADRPFHFVIHVPASAAHHADLIRRIAELEKPAATTCDVAVEPSADEPAQSREE